MQVRERLSTQESDMDDELLTVRQTMELTRLGRSTIYKEIMSGRLGSVRVGRTRRIPRAELRAWVRRGVTDTSQK